MELNNRLVKNARVMDGYFDSAEYEDGTDLSDDELAELTDMYPEVVYEMAYNNLVTF